MMTVLAVLVLGLGGGGAWFAGLLDPFPTPDPPIASNDPPATDPPATDPPATDPPATDPPETDPPATDPPATDPPATDPPATDPPATDPPATEDPAAAQLAFVRGYAVPACTLLSVISAPGAALALEGFGTSVDPFSRFLAEFAEKQGVEPDVAVRIVNEAQCPVVDYVNELRGNAGIPVRLTLDLSTDVVRSGETVSGKVEGLAGRSLSMFLVNGPGQSTNLKPFLVTGSDGTVTFSFAPSLKAGSEPTPQLLFALVTDQPVDKFDAVPNGVTARTLVPFFKSELSKVRQDPTVAVRYFRLENR
jgi:serine/threonine-protein kinase